MDEKRMTMDTMDVIRRKYQGRQIAFISCKHHQSDPMFVLGVVIEHEDGYTPLSWQLAWSRAESAMQDHAKQLNEAMGIPRHMAASIIASSMRTTR